MAGAFQCSSVTELTLKLKKPEKIWLLRHESRKNIIYEKIELIIPERREELIADLKLRTGIDIIRIEIRRIDFLRDVANIRIFYYEDEKELEIEMMEVYSFSLSPYLNHDF